MKAIFKYGWLFGLMMTANAVPAENPALAAVRRETLLPYSGTSIKGVDTNTLTGKTMCGYQGWFNAEGDGADRGFIHWTKGRGPLGPKNAKIDLWPDISELAADERFPTDFKLADGSTAEVFSSYQKPTVLRHFQWMKDYGIDGVFVQRFITDLGDPKALRHNNTVLANCREGANLNGRAYAVMYDLSGLGGDRIQEVIDDWTSVRNGMKITADPAYLKHRGKPLVAVWGVGFNDKRAYTLAECRRLIETLKADGCSVMLGVPTHWRTLSGDAVADPLLHEIICLADVVSPWTVGRYRTPEDATRHGGSMLKPDREWCDTHHLDYLPVVFPGFSWANMKTGSKPDEIPRLKGRFLWSQFLAAKRAGAKMAYVAMFDEVDEGTAIFKCTNQPPVSSTASFVTYEGLPSDFYLWLTGKGTAMIRGDMPVTDDLPQGGAVSEPPSRKTSLPE